MYSQPNRRPPTTNEVIARQRVDAEKHRAAATKSAVPAVTTNGAGTAVAAPDNRSPVERYVDEIAPSTIAGRLIKFSKEGKFIITETGDELNPDEDFVALCDETLIGWIKFGADGEPPERHQGLLYGGFVMPSRESLGDNDQGQWPVGLSGQPTDPWQHQICLVLQSPATQELFTFSTTSQTGRRAIGNLLRHYDRMRRNDPNSYPVIRLKPSGFEHRDERVGWVHVPAFAVVGRTPKNSAAIPDTSPAADMNDEVPF
jgi:hypothetical protein